MVRLSIYSDDSNWPDSGKNSDYISPLNLACPRCGMDGDFVTDKDIVVEYGFDLIKAKYGICIKCAETSTVDVEGAWNNDKEYDYSQASVLIFLDRTEEELENAAYKTKFNSYAEQKKYRMKKKSSYRSALTEERYQNLDPPYFVGSKAGWESGIKSKEREEISTFVDFKNDWFDNLLPSIISLEMDLDKGNVSKSEVPTRLVYSLVCTYLHKTSDMKNIETLTSFFKRMRVGQKDLLVGLEKWYCPLERPLSGHLSSMKRHEPSISSIDSLLSTIKNSVIDVKINDNEFDYIRKISHDTLNKLYQTKVNDKTLIDLISPYLRYRDIAICDSELPLVGLIETLCVRSAANKILEKRKARVLERKYLLPAESKGIFSYQTQNLIDRFEYIIQSKV